MLLVLGLSLGASALYSVVRIIANLTAEGGVAGATARLNTSRSPRPNVDLAFQLLDIAVALVPVALVIFLLAGGTAGTERLGAVCRRIGLSFTRPLPDLVLGFLLALVIGVPGLGLFALGRALGLNAQLEASGLASFWWTVPVLVLSALRSGLVEEVIVVAYLLDRLQRLGWSTPLIIAVSALVRGSYHLYQGWGPFVGNAIMGVVFSLVYLRTRRVMPLVIAHTLIDVVAFVGYQYLAEPLGLA